MRKIYFLLLGLLLFNGASAQIVNFYSADFKTRILLAASPTVHIAKDLSGNWVKIDTNNDGSIQNTEADNISYLDLRVYQNFSNTFYVSSFAGIENFHNLQTLYCGNPYDSSNIVNRVTVLDLSGMTHLVFLDCSLLMYFNTLITTGCTSLETINCSLNNDFNSVLSLTNLPALKYLDCSQMGNITNLDFTGSNNILSVDCSYNSINTLDLSGITSLRNLTCSHMVPSNNFALNVLGCTGLKTLDIDGTRMATLNLSDLPALQTVNYTNNTVWPSSFTVAGCPSLITLNCNDSFITSLTTTGLPNLQTFNCSNNKIVSLNLSGCGNLVSLNCATNSIGNITLTGCNSLATINCSYNYLPNFTLQNLPSLTDVILTQPFSSYHTTLNVINCPMLHNLNCSNRNMTALTIEGCPDLQTVNCSANLITSLNLEQASGLQTLNCSNNLLTELIIKNGSDESSLTITGNPNLATICTDESQIGAVQNVALLAGYTNCLVSSYCTFAPAGSYYAINVGNHVDSDNNGCDDFDLTAPFIKYIVEENGNPVTTYLSNSYGTCYIPVQAGSYTVAAALENPSYYNVSSDASTIDFPSDNGTQSYLNFCLTPAGNHPDLKAAILPLNSPRPNVNVTYKIVYKNKGTSTQSGAVNLIFDDPVLNMISATPVVSLTAANSLTWNFSNLHPFETRQILVTFHLNSPTDTPPVSSNYALNFSGAISSSAVDETPEDNAFALNQTVFNSFDPNDKTCLEGAKITPEMVGKDVHYIIRFENTGTAYAQHIVVKDMIDTAKFDINSLIPLDGSHPFVTRISDNGKVEFIFENIFLPFNDADNDGYVAFKIKTKPTLVLGNTFSNTASIYFDYNFPIVTNTATTTVALLAKSDFAFGNYFKIYPNPANDLLNIETKKQIEMRSVSIYNTLGQLMLVIPNAQNTKLVDVSNLKSGTYFIKIVSDKGSSNAKFIKK